MTTNRNQVVAGGCRVRAGTEMNAQDCRTATGLSSEQRLLKMLQASPEQQAAIDRILLGQVELGPVAAEAAAAVAVAAEPYITKAEVARTP